MRTNPLFALGLGLLLAACDSATPEGTPRDDGSILIKPRRDARIHPKVHSPIFTYPYEILDDSTGYRLTKVTLVGLVGMDGWFTEWKLDRSKAGKPAVHFLTRDRRDRVPGTPPWAQVVEIAYAKTDGYLPLEDALYPADLSFARIAGMLDLYGLQKAEHGRHYLDNRVPNRKHYEQWAEGRMRLPYLLANFDSFNPLSVEGARLYLPGPRSATYHAGTNTAVAADGSRLHSDNRHWNIFLDRSGVRDRIHATWSDAAGNRQVRITMVPLRGYRKGYGDTRVVNIIIDGTPPKAGMADAGTPDGKTLADLINVTVPIAGEHAGHMVVIDNRTHPGEWR